MILTDKATFRFDPKTRLAVLASVHPGIEVDEVVASTGYIHDFVPAAVGVTPAPTAKELRLLRQVIDPSGAMLSANSS